MSATPNPTTVQQHVSTSRIDHNGPMVSEQQDETARLFSHETAGGNNGYQRYLSSYHQPTPNINLSNAEPRGSKMTRSLSTRSLSFTDGNEVGLPIKDTPDKNQASTASRDTASKVEQMASIENANLDNPNVMHSFLMKPCQEGKGMNKDIKTVAMLFAGRNHSTLSTSSDQSLLPNKTCTVVCSMPQTF